MELGVNQEDLDKGSVSSLETYSEAINADYLRITVIMTTSMFSLSFSVGLNNRWATKRARSGKILRGTRSLLRSYHGTWT